jgi:hypothetical protein
MDESSFDNLKTGDYSQNPREQVRYAGQLSAVRFLDPTDRIDAQKLKQTITNPNVQHWMSDLNMNEADFVAWMQEQGSTPNRRHYLFAVSGSQRTKPEDIGEIQGFIYFYSSSEEKLQAQKLIDAGILTPDDLEQKRLLEISYAKSPDSPPGRITGGIMQSCLEVSKIMQRKSDTDPENILVLAYIDPENTNSIRAVEAAGFDEIGSIASYGDEIVPNKVFRLNWDKLHKNLQSAAFRSLT